MTRSAPELNLEILPGGFSVHRLAPDTVIPMGLLSGGFFNICRTDDELSIVCDEAIALPSQRCDSGWSCLKIVGPLDFALTGILARLSGLLADAGISIFAMSTFDTDYILVKTPQLDLAVATLKTGGYSFP